MEALGDEGDAYEIRLGALAEVSEPVQLRAAFEGQTWEMISRCVSKGRSRSAILGPGEASSSPAASAAIVLQRDDRRRRGGSALWMRQRVEL